MRATVCTMANALTAARVLLALPFAFLMTGGGARRAALAALVLAAAIATDVLGGDSLVRAGFPGLQPAVTVLVWALVVSTVLSMAERLWAVTRPSRRAPGSPAGERGDPPRR